MVCEICNCRPATERHHRFPQKKWAIRKYGRTLINSELNSQYLCRPCHITIKNWNEREFCKELGLFVCVNCSHWFVVCALAVIDRENCRYFDFDLEKYKGKL